MGSTLHARCRHTLAQGPWLTVISILAARTADSSALRVSCLAFSFHAAAFRQLTDAYAIVCAEILADDRRRGGGRGQRDGGGAQPSTAEIMREITDDILEMVEMDVDAEAGPRGWLPPAG